MTGKMRRALIEVGLPAYVLAMTLAGCSSGRDQAAMDHGALLGGEPSRIEVFATYDPHTGRFAVLVKNTSTVFLEVRAISIGPAPSSAHPDTPPNAGGAAEFPLFPVGDRRSALVVFQTERTVDLMMKPNDLYGPYWLTPGVSCTFSTHWDGPRIASPGVGSLGIATVHGRLGSTAEESWLDVAGVSPITEAEPEPRRR